MKHTEFDLQKQVCNYLKLQYPKILFMSDTVASLKLTMGQAVRNKQIQKEGFKTPDLIVLHPTSKYHGLFIELKTESPYLKSNPSELKKNDHIEGQLNTMYELIDKGYWAAFAWTFEMAKEIIDNYLKPEPAISEFQRRLSLMAENRRRDFTK